MRCSRSLTCRSGYTSVSGVRRARNISVRSKNPEPASQEGSAEPDEEPEYQGRGNNKLTAGSLIELIGFGLGAPVPSAIEFDREKKVVRMDFEANNFDQQYAYFEEGYVDEDADVMKKIGEFFGFGRKKGGDAQ